MLGPKGGGFHSSLQLGVPVDRGQEVEDSGNGLSTDEVVEEIGIHISGGDDGVATWGRAIVGDFFTGSRVARVEPVILLLRNVE